MGSVGFGKDEWRAEFDDVVMGSVRSGEDSEIAEAIYDVRGLLWRRLSCFGGADQIEAEKEPGASHIADQRISLLKLLEFADPKLPDAERILLQFFFLQDIQHSETSGAGDGISSKGAEKFHTVVE